MPGYKPCDLLQIQFLSLVEITVFRLDRIFQPMRALKFITLHMVYNPAYTSTLRTTATKDFPDESCFLVHILFFWGEIGQQNCVQIKSLWMPKARMGNISLKNFFMQCSLYDIVAKEERRKYRENCHYFTEKVFKVVCGYALKDAIYSQGI